MVAQPEASPEVAEIREPLSLVAGAPTTLRLEPPTSLARQITERGSETLRLTLDGLQAPPGLSLTVRVFINFPDAVLETPNDHPSFIGEVGFFPVSESSGPESFLLDAGQAIDRQPPEARLIEERFLDVTLIVVPPDNAPAPEGAAPIALPLKSLRLQAIPPENSTPEISTLETSTE